MFRTGASDYIEYFSYHVYTWNEYDVFKRVKAFRGMCDHFNPAIRLIQGESGSQSRSDGRGALRRGGWTPLKQAKQLARHTMADLMTEVEFTSYFSALDMAEGMRGTIGDKSSYMDFGYFGVLGAQFDDNGCAVGEYSPKLSYKVLQTICSVFAEEFEVVDLPVYIRCQHSERVFGEDVQDNIISAGFRRKNGAEAFVYWYSADLMTTDFQSTISLQVVPFGRNIRLIDLMNGRIYKIPTEMTEENDGAVALNNIPVKDTPLLLTFGDF